MKTGWHYIEDNKNDYLRPLDKSDEKYYINPDPIVIAKHFSKVEMQEVTNNGIAKQYLLSPRVNEQITSGVSALNRGIYSKAELDAFANVIKIEW
jgi:hypothetical protein